MYAATVGLEILMRVSNGKCFTLGTKVDTSMRALEKVIDSKHEAVRNMSKNLWWAMRSCSSIQPMLDQSFPMSTKKVVEFMASRDVVDREWADFVETGVLREKVLSKSFVVICW
jgi:hypothetical protein